MQFEITPAEATRLLFYPNNGFYLVFMKTGDVRPEIAGGEWIGLEDDMTEADYRCTRLRKTYSDATPHYARVLDGTMTLVAPIYPLA